MSDAGYDASDVLARLAARLIALRERRGRRLALPPLWMITDPDRMPDPAAAMARAPRGSAVIYRHFGHANAPAIARELKDIARARGLRLFVAADPALAAAVGADGVHWPERRFADALAWRRRHPTLPTTMAVHSPAAICRTAALRPSALLLSPIARTRSASGGRPWGFLRLSAAARTAVAPIIALGGLTTPQACEQAVLAGADGAAGVDLFLGKTGLGGAASGREA